MHRDTSLCNGLNSLLVGITLCLKLLVLLKFVFQVGWVKVALIVSNLLLFLNPALCLCYYYYTSINFAFHIFVVAQYSIYGYTLRH